eukprot:Gb_06043 [translate_table: standard]
MPSPIFMIFDLPWHSPRLKSVHYYRMSNELYNGVGGVSQGGEVNAMHTCGGFGIGEGGNPLLVRIYACFLHEVQHDLRKAQEYCERAILASTDEAYLGSHHQSSLWPGLATGDFGNYDS